MQEESLFEVKKKYTNLLDFGRVTLRKCHSFAGNLESYITKNRERFGNKRRIKGTKGR